MELKIGNRVKFINENLEGEIQDVLSDNMLIVTCSDGFDHRVSIDEVLIVNSDNAHAYLVNDALIKDKIKSPDHFLTDSGILNRYTADSKFKVQGILEIDLHLEELVEFPGKLDDWQKLYTQMQHVKKCLNAAIDKNIRKIIFIHGVGAGVLRTELRNYLANFSNIIVNDADYREYGVGATEVMIKN